MTLKKAIKLLEEEYERAKKLDWVRNPLAYALFKVWRMSDTEGWREESGQSKAD